jgi:GT2 family glycosyltransferase
MNGISILVVCRDNLRYLKNFVKSVRETTTRPYEIRVWDNATAESMEPWCSKETDIIFYREEENRGIGVASNTMCREAKYDYVTMLDPDSYLLKGWDNGVEAVEKYGGWRAPMEIGTERPARCINANFGETLENFDEKRLKLCFTGYIYPEVRTAPFFPNIMRKEDWISIGGFDERFLVAEEFFTWEAFHYFQKRGQRMLTQSDSMLYHIHAGGVWRPPGYSKLRFKWDHALREKYGNEAIDNYHQTIERWKSVGPSLDNNGNLIEYK